MGKREAMVGGTEDRVRRLRELRDGGAISEEDYRKMVLDLLDDGDTEEKGVGEKGGSPSPEPDVPVTGQTAPKSEPAVPTSEQPAPKPKEPAGRPPKPAASAPVADAPKATEPTLAPKGSKTPIIVTAVVLCLLALFFYGLYSGDIAFKPEDVSQEYWNAGRKARSIGRQYVDGKITAEDAGIELAGCYPHTSPGEAASDSEASGSEWNNENIEDAIRELDNAIEQKSYIDDTGVASSDTAVREALKDLDKALRGEV